MSESNRQYLIVGPSWVGDMVMAQSLFITLKQRYPGCEIDVVSPQWSLPVLERMQEVRQGIALSVQHGKFSFAMRYRLGRSLVARNYSHAIVLPRSWVERGLRIAVSKKNPQHRQIVEAFDRAIEDMRQDGSYFAILAQFRVSP